MWFPSIGVFPSVEILYYSVFPVYSEEPVLLRYNVVCYVVYPGFGSNLYARLRSGREEERAC